MAEESLFRGVIDFFNEIGLYDVVLPFLLVFTIVFAILEKTKVLGIEKVGDKEFTRKNLNSMVAFVIGFFVIASSKLVEVITTVSSYVVILLMLSILFLLLIGSFMKEGEGISLKGGWKTFFIFIMFIGIVLIFMHALGWLETLWNYVGNGTGGDAVGSIILIVVIVLFMVYILKEPGSSWSSDSKSEDK